MIEVGRHKATLQMFFAGYIIQKVTRSQHAVHATESSILIIVE